ncbi:TetR family transcriptional regulator C-terminal domain-containing protein [Rhodococcus triatomae]
MDVRQAFVVAARTDPSLADVRDRSDRAVYDTMLTVTTALQDAGILRGASAEVEAMRLHALLDGLAAHGVNHPHRMNADRIGAVLDAHFDALVSSGATP